MLPWCAPRLRPDRQACVVLVSLLMGCAQLKFLKPATVPVARGSSSTERGPAFGAPLPSQIDTVADWLTYNRNLEGVRGSPLREIDTATVGRLRPACSFALDERANFQSGPIVVGGTMYVTTAEYTYAIDASSCELRWKHRYQYTPRPDFDLKVNRGVAYADGRLFRGANDARVYAGGDNFGVTGRMMAFDTRTGGRVWSFDLVADAGEAGRTWPPSTEVIPRAGGATWTSYTLDTLAGSVFLATGNAAPDFLGEARPGANLHTTSVVELDARLGTLKSSRQLLKRDIHDWDLAAAPVLVTTASGRRIIAQGGKDGHVYAINRKGGDILYRTPVTRIENVEAPLTREGTRFCPGVNGGIEWNGPSYSRTLNAFYVNAIDWCTTVKVDSVSELEGKKGLPWTGSSELRHPFGVPDSVRAGWLTAIDAETGQIRWNYHSPTPLVAGITSTAGELVFTGDLRGDMLAFDGQSGALRWRYSTGLPIGGGVVTYRANGRQYVAVAAGMHAPMTWKLESSPAKVLVFSLP